MDDRHAGCFGVAYPAKPHRAALDLDGALILGVHAGEDFHQGAFAGAVFAQRRVDLAHPARKIDTVVGQHAGEALDNAAHFHSQWRGG